MQEKMFALMQEWESGDQSPREFCSAHAIKEHVFYYWRKKYTKSKAPTSEGFIPVAVGTQGTLDVPMVEIAYPNGTVVRLANGASLSMVRSLIGLV
jgi:hypothetical protein